MANIDDAVLRRLRSIGGVRAWASARRDDLRVSVMGAEPITFAVEVKHRLSDDVVQQLDSVRQREKPLLLVVRALSPQRREQLRARDVSWVEYGTGVVHLRAPGLAIDTPEDPSQSPPVETLGLPNLSGKAGIVVEALLELAREREFVGQPEVAKAAGSTQAWVSKVFTGLVSTGALEVQGAGPKKAWRPRFPDLLDLWIGDRGTEPRPIAMYVWARSPDQLLVRMKRLQRAGVKYAVGGVAAGDLHEPTLSLPPTPTVWIPAAIPAAQVAKSLNGEIVETGANLLVWQTSGDPALRLARPLGHWRKEPPHDFADLHVVTPARAVVECMQASGRGREVGEKLREKILREAEISRTKAEGD